MARQIFEHHPRLGYRFVPGIKARIPHEGGGYLIRTNQLGFRCDHEVAARPAEGLRRVLLFGDSFTAGDGVSNGRRFGDLVEQRVSGIEVLNFGLPGTGTDQHYLAYEAYGRELHDELLVIAVLVENIRRVAARYRYYSDAGGRKLVYAKPYYELEDGRLALRQVPVPRDPVPESDLAAEDRQAVDRGGRFEELRGLVRRLGLRDAAQRVTRYQPVPEYDDPRHPAWCVMRAILERWIAEHPAPVLVMPIPLYQFIEQTADPSGYQARFGELAAATGCALHDPLAELARRPARERREFRFPSDPHLTEAGHAALAASLAPAVERALGADRPAERAR